NMMALKEGDDKKVWAVSIKGNSEFIGLVAFLTNDKEEDEIGYRFREKFWGKGFGTEITKFIIAYGFNQLKMELITADVDSRNHRSVKILEKFFNLRETFFNEEDQTIDRRYEIDKNSWKAKWS
ncbi:MAG: GNAT family N-acetyltransferase, partial [Flavobacteriales bacterium]|nr:GNAT family N-acetyltransferase [Flavobacteriales bacterium]